MALVRPQHEELKATPPIFNSVCTRAISLVVPSFQFTVASHNHAMIGCRYVGEILVNVNPFKWIDVRCASCVHTHTPLLGNVVVVGCISRAYTTIKCICMAA